MTCNAPISNAPDSRDPRAAIRSGGKGQTSRNTLMFGIAPTTRLLPREDKVAYEKLRDAVVDELRPRGAIEQVLVDGILGDMWRPHRLERAEAAHWKERIESQAIRRRHATQARAVRAQGISGGLGFMTRINAPLDNAKRVRPIRADLDIQLARSVSDLEALQVSTMIDHLRKSMSRRICQSRLTLMLMLMQERRSNPHDIRVRTVFDSLA